MNRVILLEIPFEFGKVKDTIYPVVLQSDASCVLVDCGYTGFLPQIEHALAQHGLNGTMLTHVVLTHHDHDHMGALAALKKRYPQVIVVAGEKEVPFIDGRQKPLRLCQAEAMQPTLPAEQQEFGRAFCEILKGVSPCPVDLAVKGGDVFHWCGGCEVVETFGHTAGHISLYLTQRHIMITGDAAALQGKKLVLANPEYALNAREAERSLQKILHCGAKEFLCYHGGRLVV